MSGAGWPAARTLPPACSPEPRWPRTGPIRRLARCSGAAVAARRELRLGAIRPGRMHDVTAVRTEGIEEQLRLPPGVRAEVDSGYTGLARDFPSQVSAPPKKPSADSGPSGCNACDHARRRQSQQRIMVEHASAEIRQWRSLQRWTGDPRRSTRSHRRDRRPGLRGSAKRPTRSRPGTELVLVRHAAC
jgi:hypothetical protein